jgi:hypothetical protein
MGLYHDARARSLRRGRPAAMDQRILTARDQGELDHLMSAPHALTKPERKRLKKLLAKAKEKTNDGTRNRIQPA